MKRRDAQITDRAFTKSLWISVSSILLCLVLLCSMTYAWFTGEVKSGENKLASGSFDLEMTLSGENGTVSVSPAEAVLLAPGDYTVSLTPSDGATVKGYCRVVLGERVYLTDVIVGPEMQNAGEYAVNAPFIFYLHVDEETTLTLTPHWGISAAPDIEGLQTIDD